MVSCGSRSPPRSFAEDAGKRFTGCDWKMFNTTDLSARGLTHKMKWFSKYSRLLPSALAIMPTPPPLLRYKNLATALRRLVSRMVRLLHITFYTASQPLVLCGRYAFLLDRFMLACELVQVRGRTEQKIWRRSHLRAPPKLWAFSHAKFM